MEQEMTSMLEFMRAMGPIGLLVLAGFYLYLRYGKGISPDHETVLSDIKDGVDTCVEQLTKLNGRLSRIEEWKTAHDKQDDERYNRHQKEIDSARETAHAIRNEVNVLRSRIWNKLSPE